MADARLEKFSQMQRQIQVAEVGDPDLGPLRLLPGTWRSPGATGWNMIALPFATEPGSRLNYRLLMNQYTEELKFSLVDKAVPNRGIRRNGTTTQADQFVVTLDYEQMIEQVAAEDNPVSGQAGGSGLAIHHEPGLWLNMTNETTNDLDIARLATIPHGDSVLALGRSRVVEGLAPIEPINGLPIGVSQDLASRYLAPYAHFVNNPFKGTVGSPAFPGFRPDEPHLLLDFANQGLSVTQTTVLEVDSTLETGGIVNIPFVVRQANAASMKSTFWIQELEEKDENGDPKLRMQYTQTVLLDFFGRRDGQPGLIRWPHVSINTLEKVAAPSRAKAQMPST